MRLRYTSTVNPSKGGIASLPRDTAVSFIPMGAISERGVLNLEHTRSLGGVENGYTYFSDGDVLIAKITPCFENGKGAIAKNLRNGVGFGTTELTVLRPRPGYSSRFIYYLTYGYEFRKKAEGAMKGTGGQKRVPDDIFRDYDSWFPSYQEQEYIASFLDDQTAHLDTLIAEKERLIELLQEYRQAAITSAVTRGLLNDKRLTERPMLGLIPSHWETPKFLRYVIITSGQVDPEDGHYMDKPLIAPNHIEPGTGRLLFIETAAEQGAISGKYLCKKGEVIYSKIRPALRKVCIAPSDCLCSADMYPLHCREGLLSEYLFWFLLSEPFSAFSEQESARVAMPKVNRDSLANMWIPLPPEREQTDICNFLKAITGALDDLRSHVFSHVEKLLEYRSALISAAATGKIDIRNYKPHPSIQ